MYISPQYSLPGIWFRMSRSVFVKEQAASLASLFSNNDTGEVVITDSSSIVAPLKPLRANFRAVMISDSALTGPSIDISADGDNPEIRLPSLTLNNEYALVVDSRAGRKTVETVQIDAAWNWPSLPRIVSETLQNVYNLRDAYSRPFAPIAFSWTPRFGFSDSYGSQNAHTILTVFYERSEPTWIS